MSVERVASSDSVSEFLGRDAAMGGPYALLGLRHHPIDDSMILRACKYRLDQIRVHPRSHTAAADEVRLAVHAAGSQLLDAPLRVELAKRWPAGNGETAGQQASPRAWMTDQSAELSPKVRGQALRLLAACGGWNSKSRKRLGQFARMNQISAAQLVSGILGPQESTADEVKQRASGPLPIKSLAKLHPIDDSLPWVLIPLAYAGMTIAMIYAGYISYRDGSAIQSGSASQVTVEEGVRPTKAVALSGTQGNDDRRHYSAIGFELDRIARLGIQNAEDAAKLSEIGDRLARQWTEFPRSELETSVADLVQTFSEIINPEHYRIATGFLIRTVQEKMESMILVTLRDLLFGSDEVMAYTQFVRNPPSEVDASRVADALARSFAERSESGTDDADWWRWWIGQVAGYRNLVPDDALGDGYILNAAYHRLKTPMGAGEWKLCSQEIVQGVQWGEGAAARIWYMGLLTDSTVRADRLAVLSRSIVTYSSAKGMGIDMILDPSSGMAAREAYLSTLRERWMPRDQDVDDVRAMLMDRLEFLIRTTQNPGAGAESLRKSVELARVNSACFARLRKDEASLYQAVGEMDDEVRIDTQNQSLLDMTSSANDELWATAARNAETTESINDVLSELQRFDSIGPKGAHSLVYLAMQAPDLDSRAQAERAMLSRRESPALLIALDRVVEYQRSSQRVRDLIREYVGIESDALSDDEIRNELFKQMIGLGMVSSGQSPQSDVDQVRGLYDQTLGVRFYTESGSEPMIQRFYESLLIEWTETQGTVPEPVFASLRLRMRKGTGPIQRFHAYQAASLELFAMLMIERNPVLLEQVRAILDGNEMGMRSSQSIYQQVLECERAMSMIWKLVLELEGVS